MSSPVVLVVEDEPLICLDITAQLENAGFMALQAADADQAIAILESRNDIRLVFTDVQMPGSMDGLHLVACIRDRWPPVRLIVTSGQHRVAEHEIPVGGRFIAKPYEGPQVIGTIKEMLQANGG